MFSQPLNLHMCCFRVKSLKTKCLFSLEKFYEEELMPLFVVYSISMLIQHCHSGGGVGGCGSGGSTNFLFETKAYPYNTVSPDQASQLSCYVPYISHEQYSIVTVHHDNCLLQFFSFSDCVPQRWSSGSCHGAADRRLSGSMFGPEGTWGCWMGFFIYGQCSTRKSNQ